MGRYCNKCGKRKASSRCDQCGFVDYYNGTSLHRYLRLPSTREQLKQLVYGKCKDPKLESGERKAAS